MVEYEKKIVYFDMMENGIRIGNSGFAKIIIQNGQLRFTCNIIGLNKTDTLETVIFFENSNNQIGIDTIHIQEGKCVYTRLFTIDDLMALEIEWEKIHSISIHIGKNRKLTAVINPDAQPYVPCVDEEKRKETSAESMNPDNEPYFHKMSGEVRVFDDKWKQLEEIYPHIHPFGDSREFLSIKPNDFVVLTKAYQCLADNSFLLHGFYNYHHVILGKISDISESNAKIDKYYIGVPGVFYEREKVVALMFGFESFECGKETVETGTFGYYMKKVEI